MARCLLQSLFLSGPIVGLRRCIIRLYRGSNKCLLFKLPEPLAGLFAKHELNNIADGPAKKRWMQYQCSEIRIVLI